MRNYQTTQIGGITHTVIEGRQLVPLADFLNSTLFRSKNYYFFEPSTHCIYSTASGVFKRLNGTPGVSRTERGDTVWTFVGVRFTKTEIANAFKRFAMVAANALPSNQTSPYSFSGAAINGDELTTKGNVIIGTVKEGKVSFTSTPSVHTTEQSWKTEIERLAKANPGVKFIAVTITAAVVAGGLVWN